MRRTLASPILAISSNRPSAILAEALSASINTARRGERASEGIVSDPKIAISLETPQETILRELQAGNTPQVRFIVPEQGQNWQF